MMRLHALYGLMTFVLLCSSCGSTRVRGDGARQQAGQDANRNLIVYYDAEIGNQALLDAIQQYGATVIHLYESLKGLAVSIPEGKSVKESVAYFEKIPGVVSVSKDAITTLQTRAGTPR